MIKLRIQGTRADVAVNTEVNEDDSIYKKIIGLANIKEVLFHYVIRGKFVL